jgi:hypothetical protein
MRPAGRVTVAAKEAVLQEPISDYGCNGCKRGNPGNFNAEFAVDETMPCQFLASTQALRRVNTLLYFPFRC